MRLRYLVFIFLFVFQPFSSASNYHLPVEKYELSNGLTVILEEDHRSSMVEIQLWVRTGSCYEGKFLGSGITHLVEHMVFKGEASGSSMRIAKELQKLGGELDASTGKEYTQFNISIHKGNLVKAMELVNGVITRAEFIQEELDKEKDVVIREMDTIEDDPHRLLTNEFFKLSFQGHPYGEYVIGRKELFKGITREDIVEYYKSKYIPRNIVLVVAGDFNSAGLKPVIENLWGRMPGIFSEPDYIPYRPSVKGPIKRIIWKDISSSYIIAGFYGPSIDSQDMYPMDVLAEIAGGGKRSRLVKKLKDKFGLVSDIDAWSYTPSVTGVWGVTADLAVDDWALVLKNILKETYRTRSGPVTEKELLRAKRRIMRRYLSGLETLDGRAADLGSNEIYTRNPLFSSTYIRGIRKVTKEDIQETAKRYFNPENLTVAVLTLKTAQKKVSKADEEKEIVKLDNVLIKEDHRLPLVTIRLAALGGLLEEGIPGLSYLASQLWLKENPELVELIESNGGSILTFSGSNSLGFTIEVFKEDIALAMDVMKRLMQEISVTRIEEVKNIQLAEIRHEEDSPYGFAFRSAKETFFEGHPYRNSILGTRESVTAISGEDVKRFFNKSLTPDNIVISIFGDVDAREVSKLCEVRPRTKVMPGAASHAGIIPKVNDRIIPKQTEQSIIILAYPGVSVYSGDRYAVELLTQIFSGQAGRLYESVREEQALSYSLGALNITGRKPGSFMFYIATTAENTDKAKQFLFNEVSRIKTEVISEEELGRVKKYLITQTQKEWESISGLSLEATLDELYGLGWDYYKKYSENIEKVTVEDIKNAANEYFRDDWHSLVIVGREK